MIIKRMSGASLVSHPHYKVNLSVITVGLTNILHLILWRVWFEVVDLWE